MPNQAHEALQKLNQARAWMEDAYFHDKICAYPTSDNLNSTLRDILKATESLIISQREELYDLTVEKFSQYLQKYLAQQHIYLHSPNEDFNPNNLCAISRKFYFFLHCLLTSFTVDSLPLVINYLNREENSESLLLNKLNTPIQEYKYFLNKNLILTKLNSLNFTLIPLKLAQENELITCASFDSQSLASSPSFMLADFLICDLPTAKSSISNDKLKLIDKIFADLDWWHEQVRWKGGVPAEVNSKKTIPHHAHAIRQIRLHENMSAERQLFEIKIIAERQSKEIKSRCRAYKFFQARTDNNQKVLNILSKILTEDVKNLSAELKIVRQGKWKTPPLEIQLSQKINHLKY